MTVGVARVVLVAVGVVVPLMVVGVVVPLVVMLLLIVKAPTRLPLVSVPSMACLLFIDFSMVWRREVYRIKKSTLYCIAINT